jgi:uncharacterized protein YbjT (DUF2867 family)
VLVIGGYGVFGSRLARRLLQEADLDVVVAGRDLARATAFTAEWGGTPYALDRDSDQQLDRALAELAPRLLIDAAGPFQAYGRMRCASRAKRSKPARTISISPTTGSSSSRSRRSTASPRHATSAQLPAPAAFRHCPGQRPTC